MFLLTVIATATDLDSIRVQTLVFAKVDGYAPVVPVPAEHAIGSYDIEKTPRWLRVKPSPVVDGEPIVSHHTFYSAFVGADVGYNVMLSRRNTVKKARADIRSSTCCTEEEGTSIRMCR